MQRKTYEFVEVSNGHSLPSPIILRQNNRKFARLPGLLLMTTMAGSDCCPANRARGLRVRLAGSSGILDRPSLGDP